MAELKFEKTNYFRALKKEDVPQRHVNNKDKKVQKRRTGIAITNKEVNRIIEVAEEEKRKGITDYCKCYKGNKISRINKFLYDTSLQPKERICFRFKAIETECRGKLRNGKEIRIVFINKLDNEQITKWLPFLLIYDNKKIGRFKNQKETIDKIKDLINYRN
ncbi:MAG: hypothetical protein EOM85_03415 [Candidatus Moranbacteria bacterium]|nr:hypothetical protein [Candidatus Moranbacteria bacterium]